VPEKTLAELEKAAKDARDLVEQFQESAAKGSKSEYVTKLTKNQEKELAKLRKEADEAEAEFKAAQAAAPVPSDVATNPLSPRNLFWIGLFVLIAAVAVVGVVVVRNILDRDSTTSETQQAADDKTSHVTPDEATGWLDITKDFHGQPEPGGVIKTTDINSQEISFIRALLVDRHFEAALRRGYTRSEPSPDNPEITRANYGLWVYLFETPDDTKIFVGDYTKFWTGRNFMHTGSYAGNGVILQDPSHVDLLWSTRNAVIRVNVGGSSDYPLPAASEDAVDVADLVAEKACHGCGA
jgi:hypothetical protein